MVDAPMLRGSVAPEFSGWYIRGDGGVGINNLRSSTSDFLPGFVVPSFQYDYAKLGDSGLIGIGVGYQFNNWFRADLTGEYRGSANYHAVASYDGIAAGVNCGQVLGGSPRCSDIYNGTVSSTVFMANGYVDLGTWAGLTPYIGAGVGFANNKSGMFTDTALGLSGGGFSTGASKTNFAWAGMAGLSYAVSQNLKLEMGYRYLNLGSVNSGAIICQPVGIACPQEVQKFKLASHDLRIGMRWMINDTPAPMMAPAPMMQPLVRKY